LLFRTSSVLNPDNKYKPVLVSGFRNAKRMKRNYDLSFTKYPPGSRSLGVINRKMLNTACNDPEILNFFNNDRFVQKNTLLFSIRIQAGMNIEQKLNRIRIKKQWQHQTLPVQYIVPHHTVPYRTVPHRTASHRTAPHRTAPHRTVMYFPLEP
jgi:hypothetical protein